MRHTIAAAVAALTAPVLLAACGSGAGDQQTGAEAPTPQPSATTPPVRPTGPPWPEYQADAYRYQLRVMCFCPDAGVPLLVTVRDGEVTEAVYARRGRGHSAGEPVTYEWLRMTIDDIIREANDPRFDEVKVRWPRGQAYPSQVWIDRMKGAVDDEIGYQIRDVETLGPATAGS